jgi:hypothetical protein
MNELLLPSRFTNDSDATEQSLFSNFRVNWSLLWTLRFQNKFVYFALTYVQSFAFIFFAFIMAADSGNQQEDDPTPTIKPIPDARKTFQRSRIFRATSRTILWVELVYDGDRRTECRHWDDMG